MNYCAIINERVIESGGAQAGFEVCQASHALGFERTSKEPGRPLPDTPQLWADWGFACQAITARYCAQKQRDVVSIEEGEY